MQILLLDNIQTKLKDKVELLKVAGELKANGKIELYQY